jgi:hypothetical protein
MSVTFVAPGLSHVLGPVDAPLLNLKIHELFGILFVFFFFFSFFLSSFFSSRAKRVLLQSLCRGQQQAFLHVCRDWRNVSTICLEHHQTWFHSRRSARGVASQSLRVCCGLDWLQLRWHRSHHDESCLSSKRIASCSIAGGHSGTRFAAKSEELRLFGHFEGCWQHSVVGFCFCLRWYVTRTKKKKSVRCLIICQDKPHPGTIPFQNLLAPAQFKVCACVVVFVFSIFILFVERSVWILSRCGQHSVYFWNDWKPERSCLVALQYRQQC